MENPNTPTSTYGGMFSTPGTTPAISYDENTKRTPNLHQTAHTVGHPSTVEGSGFSVRMCLLPVINIIDSLDIAPDLSDTVRARLQRSH